MENQNKDETSIELRLRSKSPKGEEQIVKLRTAGTDSSDAAGPKASSGFAQTSTVLRQLKENRARLQMDNTILRAHREHHLQKMEELQKRIDSMMAVRSPQKLATPAACH